MRLADNSVWGKNKSKGKAKWGRKLAEEVEGYSEVGVRWCWIVAWKSILHWIKFHIQQSQYAYSFIHSEAIFTFASAVQIKRINCHVQGLRIFLLQQQAQLFSGTFRSYPFCLGLSTCCHFLQIISFLQLYNWDRVFSLPRSLSCLLESARADASDILCDSGCWVFHPQPLHCQFQQHCSSEHDRLHRAKPFQLLWWDFFRFDSQQTIKRFGNYWQQPVLYPYWCCGGPY